MHDGSKKFLSLVRTMMMARSVKESNETDMVLFVFVLLKLIGHINRDERLMEMYSCVRDCVSK